MKADFKDEQKKISDFLNKNNNITVVESTSNIVSENIVEENPSSLTSSEPIMPQPRTTNFSVLFNGCYLQKKTGIQRLKYFEEKDKEKY